MTALKTLIFTIVAPGTVTALVPFLILRAGGEPWPAGLGIFRFAGPPLVALGVGVYLWCAGAFTWIGRGTPAPLDAPTTLVARGLYRCVRNPMYWGVLGVVLGEAAWFESPRLLIYTALVWLAFHLFVVLYEEPTLRRTFGDDYAAYCRMVPRWIPRVRRIGV